MGNNVTIESRYLKYNKAEVEALLDKVDNAGAATEESVRSIVKDWGRSTEPESAPEPEPELEPEQEPETSGE